MNVESSALGWSDIPILAMLFQVLAVAGKSAGYAQVLESPAE